MSEDSEGRVRARRAPGGALLAAAWTLWGGLGCAPLQAVHVAAEPAPWQLFVDGEAREGMPGELELRADRDHKLFFKSDGHRPALVVLRSVEGPDGERLEPGRVSVRLVPVAGAGRRVEVEELAPAGGGEGTQ